MANFVYDLGRQSFLLGQFVLSTDNIKMVLCTSGYTANAATDQFHAIIGGGNIVATSGNFTTKTTTAGVFDADDITYTAVTGSAVTQMVIYQDTGVSATSRLICNINVATGLPVTPNGGNIVVAWDNGANKIFKI
jgi:hypothetical protein